MGDRWFRLFSWHSPLRVPPSGRATSPKASTCACPSRRKASDPSGLGGAFVGLADDVTAVSINPAGLVTVPRSFEVLFAPAASKDPKLRWANLSGGFRPCRWAALGFEFAQKGEAQIWPATGTDLAADASALLELDRKPGPGRLPQQHTRVLDRPDLHGRPPGADRHDGGRLGRWPRGGPPLQAGQPGLAAAGVHAIASMPTGTCRERTARSGSAPPRCSRRARPGSTIPCGPCEWRSPSSPTTSSTRSSRQGPRVTRGPTTTSTCASASKPPCPSSAGRAAAAWCRSASGS